MTELDDAAFLAAFEAGQRPGGAFGHVDHLRLAWVLLRRDGLALGEERIAAGIRRFADAQGTPALYHDTLTRAWVRLVAAALAAAPPRTGFAQLLDANPLLADKSYLFRFYSAEALSAPSARRGWVQPDLQPLPSCPAGASLDRRAPRLRAAFLAGAIIDALAVVPMLVPSAASLLWGFDEPSGAYRFAMGYAASLMLAWTGLLIWAWRRPVERAFVAPLTVLVIYGLVATEIASVASGHMPAWRMAPTWALQAALLALFAGAYHDVWSRPRRAVAV
jgi:hypothetical protein